MQRQPYLLKSDGISFTHTWGSGCNLKCPYCLNAPGKNLNRDKELNFRIAEIQAELQCPNTVYVEHGGELLWCNYTSELLEYKINHIKDYKAWLFTNGTNFSRFKKIFDLFYNNIEFFLSYHADNMTEAQLAEFLFCVEYLQDKTGYCNIAIVYHDNLNFEKFAASMDILKGHQVRLKVWFDCHIFDQRGTALTKIFAKSMRFMTWLDPRFTARTFIEGDLDTKFSKIVPNIISNRSIDRRRISIEVSTNGIELITGANSIDVGLDEIAPRILRYINEPAVQANTLH